MKSFGLVGLSAVVGLVVLSATVVGCNSGGGVKPDGGVDANKGDGPGVDRPTDVKVDGGMPVKCSDGGLKKQVGDTCACASDCESGFCADGVCCNTACDETCKACNTQGARGMCSFVPAGLPPTRSTCATEAPETCGTDGTCDGKGACRKHEMGTVCAKGACDGAGTAARKVCDGAGVCGAEDLVCAPYSCDPTKTACFDKCVTNSDCAPGVTCVAGSCGPKMKGAVCTAGTECLSGFCVDGVCCDGECKGGCVSCKQKGREGTCGPIDVGVPDPRGVCKDAGQASCGLTGTCDGFGGCQKYARDSVCVPPSCAGDKLNTAGTCDGLGTCQPPSVQECPPYRCAAGACKQRCESDGDCVAGIACVNNSCGPKQNGGTCKAAADCKSNFCVDGVCCDQACTGACRSCSLESSKGKCTPLGAGAIDNRNVCKDQGAPSCGTDGKCDGAGGCRKYAVGTVCTGEKCAANIYTGASTCNATGQCVAPASRPCAPFACNGATKCFNACTSTANCVSPNVCNGNSCGKKLNGAPCSAGTECASNVCAQGVCCATTCNASCKSCNLGASTGTCTNVATGTLDPKGICLDQGAASCGTNGRCAAGQCQRYAAGVKCKDATCPAGTTNFTGQSTCDGAGKCTTPTTTSCFPFTCGVAACKNTCTANADCSGNNVCINGSCGLRSPGSPCNVGTECTTGVCSAEKVCCDTACNGPCVSCKLPATNGKCSPIAAGNTDPTGQCMVSAPATCGNDGKCNGAGACTKYPANTPCAPASCPAGQATRTLGKTCNGAGACSVGGGAQACAPFTCDGAQACRDTCVTNADCVAPNTCVGNVCGKKPAGATCSSTDQCSAGLFCTDGFCCNSASCGACKACNATGACQNDDGNACTATDMCHVSDGTCSGGACQRASISCDDNNPCTADSCDAQTGCVHTKLTGTQCNDQNACTQTDTCQAGVCTGSNPVTCGGATQCKTAGVCNPATGGCTNQNMPDGTGCNDGNACTQSDKCDDGACVPGAAVTCTALDQCHTAGTCNPANGQCSQPAKNNGTGCDDDNACTQSDTCQGGSCVGANPVTCAPLDQCHAAGTCNPNNGQCSNPAKNNGAGCDDDNACTQTDTCQGGSCQGGNPVVCSPSNQCHLAGTCNPSSGQCSNPQKDDGSGCTDNNLCTDGDQCVGGACQPGAPMSCDLGLVCDPSLGLCLPFI
jgi:hypothetical protein